MGALCHRAGMRPALTHRKPLSRVPALGDLGQGTAAACCPSVPNPMAWDMGQLDRPVFLRQPVSRPRALVTNPR